MCLPVEYSEERAGRITEWQHIDNMQDSRYRSLNTCAYAEHGTLEIRLHSGTSNPAKIANWITFLLLCAEIAYRVALSGLEAIHSGEDVIRLAHGLGVIDLREREGLLAYFKNRQEKFRS